MDFAAGKRRLDFHWPQPSLWLASWEYRAISWVLSMPMTGSLMFGCLTGVYLMYLYEGWSPTLWSPIPKTGTEHLGVLRPGFSSRSFCWDWEGGGGEWVNSPSHLPRAFCHFPTSECKTQPSQMAHRPPHWASSWDLSAAAVVCQGWGRVSFITYPPPSPLAWAAGSFQWPPPPDPPDWFQASMARDWVYLGGAGVDERQN